MRGRARPRGLGYRFVVPDGDEPRSVKVTIRLTPAEAQAVHRRAVAEGFTSAVEWFRAQLARGPT